MSSGHTDLNSPEGKAAPVGDASDSGRVAHSTSNAGVTPAPRVHTERRAPYAELSRCSHYCSCPCHERGPLCGTCRAPQANEVQR